MVAAPKNSQCKGSLRQQMGKSRWGCRIKTQAVLISLKWVETMLLKWRSGQFGPSLAWCRCACLCRRRCPGAADPGTVQSREEQLERLHPKLSQGWQRGTMVCWHMGGGGHHMPCSLNPDWPHCAGAAAALCPPPAGDRPHCLPSTTRKVHNQPEKL